MTSLESSHPILFAKTMKNPAVHTEQVPPLPLTESPALQDQGILLHLLRNRHFAVLLPQIIYSLSEARGLQSPTSMSHWLVLDLPEQASRRCKVVEEKIKRATVLCKQQKPRWRRAGDTERQRDPGRGRRHWPAPDSSCCWSSGKNKQISAPGISNPSAALAACAAS